MAEAWSAVPEWIRKSEADWITVQSLAAQNNSELCDVIVFHAQQCVEKLLKARLIQLGGTVQKIHDLAVLSKALQTLDATWSWQEEDLVDLSDGAVLARYPGFETSQADAEELIAIAAKLRAALLTALRR